MSKHCVVVIWMLLLLLLLGAAKIHGDGNPTNPAAAAPAGNPANELVALVNGRRAASKLPLLRNSAGLGCMALQYISECMAMAAAACSSDHTVACQPPEAHITEVYATNCGVELPTVDIISGRLVGCCNHREDVMVASAMANGNGSTQSQMMLGKEHSQVGAALDRHGRDGPFFWCLLFSSGSANSTFLLDAGGKGIHQTHGCFSAPDTTTCNAAAPGAGAGALLLLFLFHFLPILLLS
ncbi:hypothetical protein SEVIR_1G386900v4 [Setaria viridis]|uniref:Bifunctional inhibitor/plant lipid transfer protein/seed storage helical domain-containing protein n=1 Tax=Setaria viridis TaxID=4556 RepID=A0A4U6WJM5_SETVI|nr:uncharacterized protein LOC117841713 [Setaria viridis]TKW42464.1 hypothetical protein SEVIR_1G386900v2 [Setaria viridis]